MGFDGHGHVMFVNEQVVIRLGHSFRSDVFVAAQPILGRKEANKSANLGSVDGISVCRLRLSDQAFAASLSHNGGWVTALNSAHQGRRARDLRQAGGRGRYRPGNTATRAAPSAGPRRRPPRRGAVLLDELLGLGEHLGLARTVAARVATVSDRRRGSWSDGVVLCSSWSNSSRSPPVKPSSASASSSVGRPASTSWPATSLLSLSPSQSLRSLRIWNATPRCRLNSVTIFS